MIYLVTLEQKLFENPEYKTISVEESLQLMKDCKVLQYDSETTGRLNLYNIIYRGLRFKKCLPLPPEMGVVKWENCWNGENPNQQPSQELTDLEGSETND